MAVILQRLTAKSLTFRGSVGRWVEELLMHIFSLSPIDTLGVFVFACKYASGLRCCTTAYKCDAVFISVVYSASWYGDSKVFLWIIFVIVLFCFRLFFALYVFCEATECTQLSFGGLVEELYSTSQVSVLQSGPWRYHFVQTILNKILVTILIVTEFYIFAVLYIMVWFFF